MTAEERNGMETLAEEILTTIRRPDGVTGLADVAVAVRVAAEFPPQCDADRTVIVAVVRAVRARLCIPEPPFLGDA